MRLPESRASQSVRSQSCDLRPHRTATRYCRQAAIESRPLRSLLPLLRSHSQRLRSKVLQSSIADDLAIWRAIRQACRGHQRVAVRKSFKPRTQTALRCLTFTCSHPRDFLLLSRCDLRTTLRAACRQAIWPDHTSFAATVRYNELGQPQMMGITRCTLMQRVMKGFAALRKWHPDQSRVKTVSRTQVAYFAL